MAEQKFLKPAEPEAFVAGEDDSEEESAAEQEEYSEGGSAEEAEEYSEEAAAEAEEYTEEYPEEEYPEEDPSSDSAEENGGRPEDMAEETEEEADDGDSLGELSEIPQDELLLDLSVKSDGQDEERTPEEAYEHALSVVEMAGRMLRYDYRDTYLRKALREMEPLIGQVGGAKKQYKRIRKKMHNARARFRIVSYKKAVKLRNKAKTAEDFRLAAEKFEAIQKYETKHHLNKKFASPEVYERAEACGDFEEQARACRKEQERLEKKSLRIRRTFLLVALAVMAGGFGFTKTPAYMRLKGDVELAAGLPDKAWQAYYENYRATGSTGAYAAYQDSRYKAALASLESEKPEEGWTDWEELAKKDYLDSKKRFVSLEQKLIAAAGPGTTVTFGAKEWTVLDAEDSRKILIRKEAIPEIAFQEGGGSCTWADSTVRAYLNGEYLEAHFSAEELDIMVWHENPAEDNPISGISGGEATRDRMYLLSASEAERYSALFGETKRCWWLRTPGALEGTMAFVNTDKAVMEYGYDTGSGKIRIKPVICIETDPDK